MASIYSINSAELFFHVYSEINLYLKQEHLIIPSSMKNSLNTVIGSTVTHLLKNYFGIVNENFYIKNIEKHFVKLDISADTSEKKHILCFETLIHNSDHKLIGKGLLMYTIITQKGHIFENMITLIEAEIGQRNVEWVVKN
jgi:hypothetical protein